MNIFRIKWVKLLGEVLFIALVLIVILAGALRAAFPFINNYRPEIQQWASNVIHKPVSVQKITASWRGLHPTISLDNLVVYDTETKNPILKVAHCQIGIKLIPSLIYQRIIPSQFHITGTRLVIHQLDNHFFDINGIKLQLAPNKAMHGPIQSALKWLDAQGDILLDQVEVDWYGQNGMVLPLTDLQIELTRGIFQRQVIGLVTIAEKIPARLRFVIQIQGHLFERGVSAKAYLYARQLDLALFLKNQHWHDWQLTQGQFPHLRVWATWSNQSFQTIQSEFVLKQLQLQKNAQPSVVNTATPWTINSLVANTAWQRQGKDWNFAADSVQLVLNNQRWPLTQLSAQSHRSSQQTMVQVLRGDQLSLRQLGELFPLIPQMTAANLTKWQTLAPNGEIKNFIVRDEVTSAPSSAKPAQHQVSAAADLNELSWQASQQIPGVQNLNGHVRLNETAGELQLQGNDVLVYTPRIWSRPFHLTQYQAKVQWLKSQDGWGVQISDLNLQDPVFHVQADADFYAYPDNPTLRLLAKFTAVDLAQLRHYVPDKAISPKFAHWLTEAFVSGKSAQGSILLQGPIKHFPFYDHSGHFELLTHVDQLNFQYAAAWPHINDISGDLKMDNARLTFDAPTVNVLGLPTQPVHAEIDDVLHSPVTVQGSLAADAGDALRFIQETPLQQKFGHAFEGMQLHGAASGKIELSYPLHPQNPPLQLNGDMSLAPGGSLAMPQWRIAIQSLQGGLHFTEHSFQSDNLQGQWLGQPVSIHIATKPGNDEASTTVIAATSVAPIAQLSKLYSAEFLTKFIQGQTPFLGQLIINKTAKQTNTRLTVDSDLTGVAINLPEPLKKSAVEKTPTHVEVNLAAAGKPLVITGNYANRLAAALSLQSNAKTKAWSLNSGDIRFGSGKTSLPQASGLQITGQINSLDESEISELLTSLQSKGAQATASTPIPIQRVNLDFNQLKIAGMTLDQANIQMQAQNNGWLVQIYSPTVIGSLLLPTRFSQQGIQGNFQRYVIVPGSSENNNESNAAVNPSKIPPLNLTVQNLFYGAKRLGKLTLVTTTQSSTLFINQFNLSTSDFTLQARGRWQGGNNGAQTGITGTMQARDLGATFKSWGVSQRLVGGNGGASFVLSWPGPAYHPDTKAMNGNFSMQVNDGRIINMGQGTEAEMGLGRVLNLLSLQNLPRRLTLDFSDLFTQGFSFDKIKGDFVINNGNAVTQNIYLNGPVAKVEAKGRIGLGTQDYNLQLTVTPYVTSSIPVAAALAAGPVVGAAAWVANKVLGGVVNHITSHTYQVTGTWSNPSIVKMSLLEQKTAIPTLQKHLLA